MKQIRPMEEWLSDISVIEGGCIAYRIRKLVAAQGRSFTPLDALCKARETADDYLIQLSRTLLSQRFYCPAA